MRLRFYRCYACHNEKGEFGRNFAVQLEDNAPLVALPGGRERGEAVSCPNCGLSNLDPALGGNVVPVELIHFEPPKTAALYGRAGSGFIACDPNTKAAGKVKFAGDHLAVNCDACKVTEAFRQYSGGGLHPSFDVALEPDKDGTTPKVPELHKYQKPTDPNKPPESLEKV